MRHGGDSVERWQRTTATPAAALATVAVAVAMVVMRELLVPSSDAVALPSPTMKRAKQPKVWPSIKGLAEHQREKPGSEGIAEHQQMPGIGTSTGRKGEHAPPHAGHLFFVQYNRA
ncbi:hypothetical protein Droror1_Dr00012265 [Drosera rotundifolia]